MKLESILSKLWIFISIPFAFQAATLLSTRFAAHILSCMLRCQASSTPRRNLKCFGYIFSGLLLFFSFQFLQGCAAAAVSGAATGIAMVNDRRPAATILEDQGNEVKALQVCLNNPEIWKKSHISAISYNNTLLLVGQTPNENFKREVEQELKNLEKVHTVHNELTVEEPISLGARSQDTWITTQVKARMFAKKDLNPSRIKVVTENGIVYLLGKTTEEEQLKATEIARSTEGVEKVVQVFDSM